MLLQKTVIGLSLLGTLIALVSRNSVSFGLCDAPQIDCRTTYDTIEHIFYFFPLVLMLCLITLRSHTSFQYWWRFAKYALPISFLLVAAVNFGVLRDDSASYIGDIDALFEFVALGLVYGVFTLGSLIQIFRGYWAGK